jgi:hypothetical protein
VGGHAAVDGDLGAGDGGGVAEEERDQRGDLSTVPVRPSGVSATLAARNAGEADAVIGVSM